MSRATYEILEIVYALKRHKNTIYGVGLLFLMSFIISYLLFYFNVEYFKEIAKTIFSQFSESVDASNLKTKSSLDIFSIILIHNLSVAFLNYIVMILSIVIMVINAFLIAYVLYTSEPLKFVLLVMPHGIVEIPALILSVSSGLLLFKSAVKRLKNDSEYVMDYKDSLRIFIISIVLFTISAIIESTITFEIAKFIH
jgi:uncharacterized membrane protein SpoIIM required for sporulation